MNLLLHGIGGDTDAKELPMITKDGLSGKHSEYEMVLANPLKRSDLDDFVNCYFGNNTPGGRVPPNRFERKESERFKCFDYKELIKRDKANLDIFWLKDDTLEDSANLPDPDVLALEMAEDLEAALEQFTAIAEDLKQ